MDGIGQVVMSACTVGIALTAAEFLVPNERFQKQLRLMFTLLLILGLLLPLADNLSALPDAVQAAGAASSSLTEDAFTELVEQETAVRMNQSLTDELEISGISVAEIETDVHISEDGSICISEVRLSCSDPAASQVKLTALLGEDVSLVITEENG